MTQKLPSGDEAGSEIPWEEAVGRYLEAHPDYFLRHPEVLARLQLRHETGGRAVSLIEHQVERLRRDNRELARQLEELVGIARDNDLITARLHRFALAMIEARTLDEVLDGAYEMLRHEFRLDTVGIRLRAHCARRECVGEEDRRLEAVLERLAGGKTVAGVRLDESLMRYLFAEEAAGVRSCALVPLRLRGPFGVLALGSHDEARFAAGLGTVYLGRLGELLAGALGVHLRGRS
jgi:uncharacterized protein YigA (DUF484 family)